MDEDKRNEVAKELLSIFPIIYKNLRLDLRALEKDLLTPTDINILVLLEGSGAKTNSEISDIMFIARPNVSAILQKLLEEGYVEKKQKDSDKRYSLFHITEKGLSLLSQIKEKAVTIVAKRIERLEEADVLDLKESVQTLKRVINVMMNN